MPLKSLLMLAGISIDMDEMAELLAAEEPELERLKEHAENVIAECSINSCMEKISRYEKIFAVPPAGKNLEGRRAAVLFQLNARLLITPQYMAELISGVLSCRCTIKEFFAEYRFTVNIEGVNTSPNMNEAARYVKLLKPAHLETTLRYHQRELGHIHVGAHAGIGLYIKVQPYQPQNINAQGNINIGVFVKGAQELKVYPKGD